MEFIYKGLKAQYSRHIVTNEEMEKQLERLLQTPRVAVITDRPTKPGDEVLLDYAGFVGEEQFVGGTAQKQTLVLGSGMFIPGFEEQLLDKVPGEKVDVTVTFPTEYHAAELAGKEAVFHCTLHEIREKTAYSRDDVFAKEVGGVETLEEMEKMLLQQMQAYSDQRGEMELQDRLLSQAAQTLETVITDEALEQAVETEIQTLSAQLGQQGLSLAMYCQFLQTDEAALRQELRPQAELRIRKQRAVIAISQLESLEVGEEDMAQALNAICRQNNITMEQLQPHYDAEFEAMVMNTILAGKVMELIRREAVIEE